MVPRFQPARLLRSQTNSKDGCRSSAPRSLRINNSPSEMRQCPGLVSMNRSSLGSRSPSRKMSSSSGSLAPTLSSTQTRYTTTDASALRPARSPQHLAQYWTMRVQEVVPLIVRHRIQVQGGFLIQFGTILPLLCSMSTMVHFLAFLEIPNMFSEPAPRRLWTPTSTLASLADVLTAQDQPYLRIVVNIPFI